MNNLNRRGEALTRPYSRKDTGWRLFLKTIIARAYPRLIGQQREISWLVFDVVMPMLAVIAYVLVYRALNAPEEYIGFVVMGGAMTAFWMNILWSMSSQLYWEKEQGNLALYIFSGAVFPLDVLPEWIRPVGYFMPTTYWLELLRRSLVGNVAQAFPTLADFSNLEMLGILLALSIFFGVVSVWVFKYCDRIARERGLIDMTTNY